MILFLPKNILQLNKNDFEHSIFFSYVQNAVQLQSRLAQEEQTICSALLVQAKQSIDVASAVILGNLMGDRID